MAEPIILVQQQQTAVIERLAAFAHQRAGWRLIACSDNTLRHGTSPLEQAAGAIMATRKEESRAILRASGLPWINLRYPADGACSIVCDERAVGRLAGRHFAERGLSSLAFIGPVQCDLLSGLRSGSGQRRIAIHKGALTPRQLQRCLSGLSRPAGVFCASDGLAVDSINAALDSGLQVPEDIAVCGYNNNAVQALCAAVPLSSVDFNIAGMADAAAQLMYAHLHQGKRLPKLMHVAPKELVQRRSTDSYSGLEPDLAMVMRLLRSGLSDGIQLEDVIADTGLSRSTIERRFHERFRQTPGQWLQQQRIEQAARLLQHSDDSIAAIAGACGFTTASYFCRAFKKYYKKTPLQYRLH